MQGKIIIFCFALFLGLATVAHADELSLDALIGEALANSPEIKAAGARADAAGFKVPQSKSLPDPMFMFGYQNEGFEGYSYGEMPDAQWMFSASQMFPFPGKRTLKEEMTKRDAESLMLSVEAARLNTVLKVKELFYDLFFFHKSIDLIKERAELFSRLEEAALARYSTGMAPQQEVLMVQTEKYMLLEKEEMLKQKIASTEAMLTFVLGRGGEGDNVPIFFDRPSAPADLPIERSIDEIVEIAYENSPEIKMREKMVSAADSGVKMAKREYYPDFTLTGNYGLRGGEFMDMWGLTASMNIPIFYRTKQRQAVNEAGASLLEARNEYETARLMTASAIRDNYSMAKASERLMELYRGGLAPKARQDFEAALAGYTTGKVEAITAITRLKALIDYESLYYEQFTVKLKAAARVDALTGTARTASSSEGTY